jgi:outer membrane protein assembly factor BamB
MSKSLLIAVLFSGLLLSCSDKNEAEPFNTRGGADRDNNYEQLGTFMTNLYSVEKINMSDSSSAAVPPLILDGMQFYVATVNGTIALIEERTAKWEHRLDSGEIVAAEMCADRDKNLYLITNTGIVRSFDKEGKFRWSYKHPALDSGSYTFDALLALSDGIVVSVSPGLLFKLSFDGKKKWEFKHKYVSVHVFCADANDNIAFVSTQNDYEKSDTLYFIASNGKVKWKKAYPKSRILKNPVSFKNLIIYPASFMLDDTRLYLLIALDTNGAEVWRQELNIMPKFISCGHENRIYLLAYNSGYGETMSGIFCYNLQGDLLWKLYTGNTVPSPLLLSEDNIAFFGTKGNTAGVFFLNKDGTLYQTVSLSDAPLFIHKPFVLNVPAVAFFGHDKMFILKIDDTAIDRILPW